MGAIQSFAQSLRVVGLRDTLAIGIGDQRNLIEVIVLIGGRERAPIRNCFTFRDDPSAQVIGPGSATRDIAHRRAPPDGVSSGPALVIGICDGVGTSARQGVQVRLVGVISLAGEPV